MKRKCPRCGRHAEMTRHSLVGGHRPPFKIMCRLCHDQLEGMKFNKKGEKWHPRRKNR
jgi:hypothetical protein